MRDIERRRLDCLRRCVQFFLDNAAVISGVAKAKFQALQAKVADADANSGMVEAKAGEGTGATDQKSTIRENLIAMCRAISDTAKGMEPDFDGISAVFRFQRNLSDADLLARAMGMATDAIPRQADFVAYNLSANFLADLNAEIAAFEAIDMSQASFTGDRVGAHAALADDIHQGMQLKRSLDPMVRNLFNGNPNKIAAWASASHVEAAPKPKPKPPTP